MYRVIAKKWDSTQDVQIEYVAGTFSIFMNAKIFCDAYNEHYHADAFIFHSDK